MTLEREWVVLKDEAGWKWEFDYTFLTSGWECIYGRGCCDITGSGTARGCCVHGVSIVDYDNDATGRADLEHLRGRVEELTDEDWQNRQVALRRGGSDPWAKERFKDNVATRVHRGACIFHNRPDHPAGAGCAFHQAALKRGQSPMDWKPRTCWQVPLFSDPDDERKTTTVRPVTKDEWGGEHVISWWCIGMDGGVGARPSAFSADSAVYVRMERELRRICGDAVYDELRAYIEARNAHLNGGPPSQPVSEMRSPSVTARTSCGS